MPATRLFVPGLLLWTGITLAYASLSRDGSAQEDPAAISEEAARQQKVMDRFLTVLEKNPRKSTALDKVYGYHVENGSLDALIKRYQERTEKDPKDGAAWMILGLIEAERGRDAAAVAAFTQAAETSKTALPAYYLGQSLVLIGQPDKAVEAFELAIARKPLATDQLDVYRALGRVHQRAQRTQEALDVWSRLEKLFPGDARVQEQIAATLVEEGQTALALPRYETLIKITKDDYRKSVYRIEAAELKVKLNRGQEAIADLEALLATLNPTSWLHREVRRKIDDVFLRTDDQDGLAKYYAGWVQKNPEDVDAMARLARILARQARVPEAQQWLDKALKLAPSRKELRLAFIEQLVDDQRYADAVAQYELLDKVDPNNPDYLRDWGKLLLRDKSRPKDERLAAAERVWRRLLTARPKDPLIATQVADLFRHSELVEPALELYRKAVELAPDQPQYREYLGEYYHQLKRPEEALATWRQIAIEKNRTAANLARLAEVLASFGYLAEAVPEMQAACKLDPKDFSLLLKAAQLYLKADQTAEALDTLGRAEKLAQNDEEAEAVLVEQLRIYQLDDSLPKRASELATEVKAESATPEQLFLLARLYEAQQQYPEALAAIEKALRQAPQKVRMLATAARIYEQSGNLQSAADLNRKLALADRRGRSDYLKHVSQLETQLGRTEQALQAGRELITSAPGNTENYEFYAELCFRLNQSEEGLQTLRRAIRVNPTEPKLLLTLAGSLAEQFRTDEAVELYWQAFEKATELDDKLGIVPKLADLYLQTNHFDRLLERIERLRRDASDKREATICLAQAYHSAGDYGMARQELESLLTENTRDTHLLQQLSKLAEAERDFAGAVKYQDQLAKLAPGPETEYRLASLLADSGAAQESAAVLVKLAAREEDPEKLLRTIDSLLAAEQETTALLIIESKLREDPKNWELLYREGAALAKRPEEAARRFEALLALPLPDTTEGIAEKNRREKAAKSKTATVASSRGRSQWGRLDHSGQIRVVVGLLSREYYSVPRIWAPGDFGQARMAALAWLYRFAQESKQEAELLAQYKTPTESDKATVRQLWDWLYLASVSGAYENQEKNDELRAASRRLAKARDPAGQYVFLSSLTSRSPRYRGQQGAKDSLPPLPAEDLALVLSAHRDLQQESESSDYLTVLVMEELKRAGRQEEGEKLLQELVAKAQKPDQLAQALTLYAGLDDETTTLALFERWAKLSLAEDRKSPSPYSSQVAYGLAQLVGVSGEAKKHEPILALLDRYLDYNQARANKERLANARKARHSATASANASNYYAPIWVGKRQQSVRIAFPTPNSYFDQSALIFLRNVYEAFQRNDVLSDLETHLRKRLDAAPAGDKAFEHWALVAVYWWQEDKERGLQELAALSERLPQDVDLQLQLVRSQMESQQYDEALAQVEKIVPLDQDSMRERESLALDLAVRLGDHDRARQAAERLFGLRLDAETQVQLAAQMRRLGMNQEADAVLARAQRQVGNRLAAQVALMNSYQADGKPDIAAQIAYQILRQSRKSAAKTNQASSRSVVTPDDSARSAALRVLGSAGKLKQMIADVEQQLSRAPEATHLYDTLVEYHQAAGDREQALAWQAKQVELRAEDFDIRQRYAQQLMQAGKASEACDQYRVILRKQPRILQNRFYEVTQAFRQAKREPELTAILGEIDLRKIGQYYYVMDLVSNLMRDKEQRSAALILFKKVWEAFPDQRQYLLSSLSTSEIWELPEMYDFGKQSLIPPAGNALRDPWWGISQIYSYSGNGETYTVLRSVLAAAAKTNRLPALRDELSAAAKERPEWKAGPILVAIVDARLGKLDAARSVIEAALEAKDADALPGPASWIAGQELETQDGLRELVARMYASALEQGDANMNMNGFEYSPGPRLVRLYIALGRREEGYKLLKQAEKQPVGNDYDPGYAAQQKMQHKMNLGQQYQELQFPVDALRLYREVLTNAPARDPNNPYMGNWEYYQRQTQQQLTQVLDQLAKSSEPGLVKQLLAPQADAKEKPVLDLMLGVQVNAAGVPRLDSQLIALLTGRTLTLQTSQAVQDALTELMAKYPEDLSVHIVAACVAIDHKAEQSSELLKKLADLVQRSPLDELEAGQRANARQREQALRQLPLWLVASSCSNSPSLREQGEDFATRALAAAQRQVDRNYAIAMLFQSGEQAAKAGDRIVAEKRLGELLKFTLARPPVKQAPEGKPAQVPPVTLSQFKIAVATARLAVDHDLPPVAMEAMREALRGGPPVPDVSPLTGSAARPARIIRSGQELTADSAINQAVADELVKLSRLWRSKQFPAGEIYAVLHEIVLPANRAGELQFHARRLSNWKRPESLGLELVRWGAATGQAETLRKEIAEREPSAKLPAQVLLALLAIETKDHAAAAPLLESLAKAAIAQPSVTTLSLGAHAAASAFVQDDLQEAALPILETIVKTSERQSGIQAEGALQLLAQRYQRRNQKEELQELYTKYLQGRQAHYAQYGGDYGLYVQRNDMGQMVVSMSQLGDPALSLDYLGRFVDLPATPNYGGGVSLDLPLWHVAWQLNALPAAERYALLRDWTLPTKQRRTLRLVAGLSSGLQLPLAFLPEEAPRQTPPPEMGLLSNFSLLVEAAREAGTLDELHTLVQKSVDDKLPRAARLSALVAVARDDASAAAKVQEAVEAIRNRMKNPPPADARQELDDERNADMLLLAAALGSPKTRQAGREFGPLVLQDLRKAPRYDRVTHVARQIALDALTDLPPAERAQRLLPGLKHWSPGTPPAMTGSLNPPAWWAAHGKHVTHLTGFEYDSLYFNYPLTGTFQFSFEAHSYDHSQGEVSYGGLICVPQFWNRQIMVMPVSRQDTLSRSAQISAKDWWNRYELKVSPTAIRFYCNGHLAYEEADPSPTSPWLHLTALDHRRSDFRNLAMSGAPVIPREINLVHKDRLEGWVAGFGARLPERLKPKEPLPKAPANQRNVAAVDTRPIDWNAVEGVLHGRFDPEATDSAQAHLYYHRPMRSGDTINYEFLYEPGKTQVHPAIGRLAFMLEPNEVRLHWITQGRGVDPIELPANHSIPVVGGNEGGELPLKPGDWNSMQLALTGDEVSLTLNGKLLLKRPLEPTIDRRFGLFHYRDRTAAQVRKIVLTGNWPEQLTQADLANLLELQSPDESTAQSRARHQLIREDEEADEAYPVWLAAQSLTPDERFGYLRDWVFPSAARPSFRLQADFTPVDQPFIGPKKVAEIAGRGLHTGGELVAPVIELVRTAAALQRLDELAALVRATEKLVPEKGRERLAVLTLIAIAKGDDPVAAANLKFLQEEHKALSPLVAVSDRYAEAIAVFMALDRPALRAHALSLAKQLVEQQQGIYQTFEWERTVRWLRAKAYWMNDAATTKLPMGQATGKLTQWAAVSQPTAEGRGRGLPPATWKLDQGRAEFFTGHGEDALYFQSPLAGDFEVRLRRTTYGWKEIYPVFANIGIDMHHQGTSAFRNLAGRGRTQTNLPAKLDKWGPQIDYRLVVKNGDYTVFYNEQQVHTERLTRHADPWLRIQTLAPHYNGNVENVQILGSPQVPESIELSAADDLAGWRSSYYGESIDAAEAIWTKAKEEIVGAKTYAPGANLQSVLYYHRPLLEDGEIECEFFYQAGETEVHPAIDRLAFLLSPDGLKRHYVTDGPYDRTGLSPGNQAPLPGSSDSVALKENDWNELKVQLKGDTVSILVNGKLVASHTLEPTNQRRFGLFRFSDATATRVRNVIYRGAWPKDVPPVEQQELARASGK